MTTFKFELEKSYITTYGGDADLKTQVTITRRTEKTVWFTSNGGTKVKRAKVQISSDGSEFIYPDGIYSMCPVTRAKKVWLEAPVVVEEKEEVPVETMVALEAAEEDVTNLIAESHIVVANTIVGTLELSYAKFNLRQVKTERFTLRGANRLYLEVEDKETFKTILSRFYKIEKV